MQGGIYNAALFGASERKPRPARDKINRMGGIMASSPELMQAVQEYSPAPAPAPSMGAGPMPMPQMPIQPTLPTQVPPQQPQAPQPMAQAPAQPAPSAPAPAPQMQQPVGFQEGGAINEQFRGYSDMGKAMGERAKATGDMVVDISMNPVEFVRQMDQQTGGAVTERYGSIEDAVQAGRGIKASIDAAVATGSEENVANTVVDQAGLPPNEEGKREFARNVFGMEDVNDIDEINRRIANVAISGSIGKGNDAYVQALLLGLGEYKKTASARAAAAADRSGSTSTYTPERLFQQAVERIMANPQQFDVYNEDGSAVDPMKVRQQAMQIATATSQAMGGGGGDNRQVAYDAQGKPYYSTDGVNYVDAQGNPYVPPQE